jgi:hypothetical protein
VLRQAAQVEHLARGQHAVAVGARERRHERGGAGADQQRVELHLDVLVVNAREQGVGRRDNAVPGKHAHVHAVHALAHPAALVQRHGACAGQRPAQVDLGKAAREVDTLRLGLADLQHRVGRRQQRLRRDRVGHRAVAAQLVVLDQGDLGAEVGGGGCGGVPGWSATKDGKSHADHRRLSASAPQLPPSTSPRSGPSSRRCAPGAPTWTTLAARRCTSP